MYTVHVSCKWTEPSET